MRQYIVHDNVVYFPTDSQIYKILNTYAHNKGFNVNSYIRSLGFERTTERPDVAVDILEKDMEVRQATVLLKIKSLPCIPSLEAVF